MHSSRRVRLGILTLVFLFTALLPAAAQEALTEAGLREFLDDRESVFEEISVQMGTANWNLYTGEGEADQDTPRERFSGLFSDEDLNTVIGAWHGKKTMEDPVLRRRVEVWHDLLTGANVDMKREVFEIENRLEAWMALPADHEDRPASGFLEERVFELLRLRNEGAREQGYANYPDMILEITGLGAGWFRDFHTMLEERTREPYRRLVEEYRRDNGIAAMGVGDVGTMLVPYARDARGVPVPRDSNRSLMIETVENLGVDFDLLPLRIVEKRVPYLGNGLSIRIPDDFRIVLSLNRSLTTWMHELGHGLEGMKTMTPHPVLKGYEWCPGNACNGLMEGTAELMVNFVQHPSWLRTYAGLSEEAIRDRQEVKRRLLPAYLRRRIRQFMLEVALYEDLDQDFAKLVERLDSEYCFVDSPRQTVPSIAASIMPVSYPVYLHNYVIGEIFAWQVHQTLAEKFGDSYPFDPRVGAYLEETVWRDGVTLPWQAVVKRATGRELDVDGFLEAHGL